jgi:predicted DNA-binding transcriptional regulator AlpA
LPATLADLANLPGWPLMLSDEQAAAYVGLSRESFRKAVEDGHYPKPVRQFGRRVLWHRPSLDRAAAVLAGESLSAGEKTPPIDQKEWDQWDP